MPVKTISLKEEAYARLKAARRYPSESFSEIVMRATWPEDTVTGRGLLEFHAPRRRYFEDAELDRIDAAKGADLPPDDKWVER